jgi:hypothetical protein
MKPANDNARLLSRAEAAAYCGFRPSAFSAHVAAGRLPAALPALRKWDRKVLDAHLDRMSGLEKTEAASKDPWAEWEETNARQSQRAG